MSITRALGEVRFQGHIHDAKDLRMRKRVESECGLQQQQRFHSRLARVAKWTARDHRCIIEPVDVLPQLALRGDHLIPALAP